MPYHRGYIRHWAKDRSRQHQGPRSTHRDLMEGLRDSAGDVVQNDALDFGLLLFAH